jgi:acyl-CoA synthetase (AMP-forming)/AMP-acid ligase II
MTMNLLARISDHAARRPGAIAYRQVVEQRDITYADLWQAARAFGEKLRDQFGEGATLLIKIPNSIDYPIAFLGALCARCAAFPVPDAITRPELNALVQQVGARALITSPAQAHGFESAGPPTNRRGLLLQSSGTTGLPKIAHRSPASLDAVSQNMVEAIDIKETDTLLATVPLCHSYGLEHGLLAPLFAGATVHLARGFDLQIVLRELTQNQITPFPAVPSMYEMLAQLADRHTRFPLLRSAYSAGGPLPRPIADTMSARYGLHVAQVYGATEIGSITFGHTGVGKPMRGVSVTTTPENEVLVRAPSMFDGYVGDVKGTFEGYFHTGDIGSLDDHNNLSITGRLKLLIDVGGLKVNPLEVEEVLNSHPAVASSVVVPMQLSQTISRVKAVVVLKPETHITADEIRQFARQRLTPHKVPRIIEFRPTLPRSATGKILRSLLEPS